MKPKTFIIKPQKPSRFSILSSSPCLKSTLKYCNAEVLEVNLSYSKNRKSQYRLLPLEYVEQDNTLICSVQVH